MQGTPGMQGMPLTFRGAAASVLKWLESLSMAVLDARPSLWVTYASTLLTTGQQTGVEEKLRAAEAALEGAESVPSEAEGSAFEAPDDKTQDLLGRIAALRATLAVGQHQVETAIAQSRRALEYLHPDNLPFRTSTTWTLGYAHHLQGDRAAARRAYSEVMSIGQSSGNLVFTIAATTGLGNLQEAENQLYEAAKTYRRVLQLVGDPSLLLAGEAQLGLARVLYQWNDLDAAEPHGLQSLELARQIDSIDTFAVCGVFLARLKLAQGDAAGAEAMLTEADQFVRRHDFAYQLPEVTAAQVRVLLCQGNLAAAADLAEKQGLPRSQARVYLAQGDTGEALAVLESELRQAEAKGWQDERLKILVLQAVAHQAHGERDQAAHLLADALALAKPGGFIRIFVDEGLPMAHLLSAAAVRGVMPDYVDTLLAAFDAEAQKRKDESYLPPTPLPPSVQPLIEPLTPREREVLQLIAAGLSNPEIAEELVIAVTTVKTHVKNIYGKLQVTRRFEAAARAQDLNLL
jgi:LuxR family maltose regulon positive regulatory protein